MSARATSSTPHSIICRPRWTSPSPACPPTTFPIYPLPEHFAEKLHAYTRPRPGGGQTRVKDLLDLSLIVTELQLQPSPQLAHVLRAVFAHYGTHPLPQPLPLPPADWQLPFQVMAQSLEHPITDMTQALDVVQAVLDASLTNSETDR